MARETAYEQWVRQEGVPVVRGYGLTDVLGIELGPWQRTGGRGAYLLLEGLEGLTGMYLGEIPPGGVLEPEKHLYDEMIYVLRGNGLTEVWNEGASRKTLFEWQTGSMFSPPMNTLHRLINGSGVEPVRFLAFTTAPVIMDLFHNPDFVMNAQYDFDDRYDGRDSFFDVGDRVEVPTKWGKLSVWETNFIPDVRGASLEVSGTTKSPGHLHTDYQMSGNVLVGHVVEWPVGRYHKAHYHGGGAILVILRSEGYTLMWPKELGIHPYQDGFGDQVIKVDWREGSVFSPPTGWFHQHFNVGSGWARQLAVRFGSQRYGVQFHDVQSRGSAVMSLREGGTMIDFDEEDPAIRQNFKSALVAGGVEYSMPEAATV